ncbi:MAG: helix-turn-helix transcriptional regulator [Erysipelotrichaceae bacterium]|nr:helix-turn-helix transcriptional regulator [Erysipelotrichaceae bacterium]
MEVSYKKLFKLLIDRDLKKVEFAKEVGIGMNTLAKMGKGRFVSMEVLVRICKSLNCTFDDIVEIVS